MSEAKRLRVLHVDDFDEFLDAFAEMFGASLEITSCGGATDALERLARERFDVVVVDYDMPEMDGVAFTSVVRTRYAVPVVFCTARGSEEVARAAFTAGAVDYFLKDFERQVDRERFVNALQQAAEHARREDSLRRERRFIDQFWEKNPFSLQMYDADGFFKRENPASSAMWGREPGRDYSGFNLLTDAQLPGQHIRATLGRGEPLFFPPNPFNPSKSGDYSDVTRYVGGVMFPVTGADGRFPWIVGVQHDHTDVVRARQSLEEVHHRLRGAHITLEQRVAERTAELTAANAALRAEVEKRSRLGDELTRRNRELELFTDRVSDDLRAELIALQGTLEVLADRPEVRARTAVVLQRNQGLLDFVRELHTLARTGQVIEGRSPVPVAALARDVFARLRPPELDAELRVEGDDATLQADPLALDQILANLLGNAFQHGAVPGRPLLVTVECSSTDDGVELTVGDDGKGISAANLDRVFDATFTTDKSGHFGLGLSLVKKLVEAHGGSLSVHSHGADLGAAFVLRFPTP